MRADLVLLVQAGRSIGVDVEVGSDEPVTGAYALAITVVDIEIHCPDIGELLNTVSVDQLGNGGIGDGL
jgi:hypothetical protein